jgi:hypothetical protein
LPPGRKALFPESATLQELQRVEEALVAAAFNDGELPSVTLGVTPAGAAEH